MASQTAHQQSPKTPARSTPVAGARSVGAVLQRTCACGAAVSTTEQCDECAKKSRTVQRAPAAPPQVPSQIPPIVHDVLHLPGEPIDPATRAPYERAFGRDFSQVRVHRDAAAAESARAVGALAYTVGQHIVFGGKPFDPAARADRTLLAHELTHTVQQSHGTTAFAGKLELGEPGDVFEREADAAAARVARGAPAFPSAHGPQQLRRVRLQRNAPKPPVQATPSAGGNVTARLDSIIRTGGPVPGETRVIGAAIIEVEGYQGPTEMRAISGAGTDALGKGARVYHASSPDARSLSATRSIAGSGPRREFPFSHINDAEIKLFEDILPRLPKDAKGTIHFTTMRVRQVGGQTVFEPYPACSGCIRASFEASGGLRPQLKLASYAPTFPTGTLDLGPLDEPKANVNPPPKELPTPKLEDELPKLKAPKVPDVAEPHGGPRGSLGGSMRKPGTLGRMGRIGAVALEGALNIALELALLTAQMIIEFVIIPKLEEWRRELEEARRQRIQDQIQKRVEGAITQQIGSTLKACYLKPLREKEKAGKKAYVKVVLMVNFEDTSDRFTWFGLDEKPPESFFDVEVDDVRLVMASLVDSPVEATTGELKRCESCGTFGRSKTFVTNNPLWEQELTFSFEAPSSESIAKEFKDVQESGDCCFIATACYGSLLAPEVDTLRRFRDRVLMRTVAGRGFIRLYYRLSPPIAVWLAERHLARTMVRGVLIAPLVRSIQFLRLD